MSAPNLQTSDQALELTILMPCLNEAETVARCVEKALTFLRTRSIAGEVIVADNGSTDGSIRLASEAGARVVTVSQRGYGSALIHGIKAARGRFVIMGDADDSYDFSSLDDFVERLRAGDKLVMGNRFQGGIRVGAMPLLHRFIGNPVLSGLGRLFFKARCKDFHCGLRGFERSAILGLRLQASGMEFASEMVVKATLCCMSISEVPVVLHPDGRSRAPHLRSWRDGWRHLRFLLLFSPRWLFLFPGVICFSAGAAMTTALVISPFEVTGARFGLGWLFVSALLTVIGYQAFLFACLTKVYGQLQGFLPDDERFNRLFRFVRLETGLLAGLGLMLLGVSAGAVTYARWRNSAWGAMDSGGSLRSAVPAALGLVLGTQTVLSSFFLSILGLERNADEELILLSGDDEALTPAGGSSVY